MTLQRAYSGFPTGYPGLALLLLRLVVGGAASCQAWLVIAGCRGEVSVTVLMALLAMLCAVALVIGAMTPLASVVLTAVAILFFALDVSHCALNLGLFASGLARLEFIAISAALIPLGPGFLSLDARLYGRREIQVNGGAP